ncbi:MAG: FAD:protein FMN transferase [Chloroflexi bacterium]|nr:FAD:protein FMN transferase [Chloroflexota bacterium]
MEHKQSLSRRDFIKITAVAGSVLAGGKLLFDLVKDEVTTVSESRLLMGTIINLAVVAESNAAGEAAIEVTFTELERQVAIFNHRESESPVAILNSIGKLAKPPQELVEVLTQAIVISEMTGGAFDVTVKPLLDLYQQSQPELPSAEAVESALSLVDYTQLSVSSEGITLGQPGMAITLDGIAKGFIVDSGTAVLKKLGFENVYVEAGGDLMASGKKDGNIPWKIGIQSPREEQPGLLSQINISNQAVATSGDYFQYYSTDMLNHHIIDPRIGFSSPDLASVTILSGNAMQSDALATAVMVLGTDKGLKLIESIPFVDAYLITKDLEVEASSGFSSKVINKDV